ncbi:MAG: TRAP transporter small permease [Pseudoflavonifractor sp.]|nr:TRAP transporter small permease [Pseudoflavonifractor sp.]
MKQALNGFEVYVGTVCSIAMVCILFANVIGRYVIGTSIKWAEEVCLMLFILSIYLGATGAVRTRQHLRLEILVGKMKPKARMIMEIIDNGIFMAFNGIMFFGIMPLVMQLYKNKTAAAVTGIPKFAVYIWLPILFAVMCIRLIQDSVQRVRDYQDDPTGEKKAAAEQAAMQSMMVEESTKKEGV